MDDERSSTEDEGTYVCTGDDKIDEAGDDQGGMGEPGHRGNATAEVGIIMGGSAGISRQLLFEETTGVSPGKEPRGGIYVKENPRVLTIEIKCGSAA
jgi:hypothetical protein